MKKTQVSAFVVVLLIIIGLLWAAIKLSTPVSPTTGPTYTPVPSPEQPLDVHPTPIELPQDVKG